MPYPSISADELIRICAESNESEPWEEFVSRFHRAITLSVIRTAHIWGDVATHVIDDLVQETYLKLCSDKCRQLRAFAVQHPEAILGYVKTMAVNVVHDHFKSLRSQKRGAGKVEGLLEHFDPTAVSGSIGSPEAIERNILLREISKCVDICSVGPEQKRDRLVFWLYYRQGMSARAIADLPTVELTAKGVESTILRLTRLIREQMVHFRSEASGGKDAGQKGFRSAKSY